MGFLAQSDPADVKSSGQTSADLIDPLKEGSIKDNSAGVSSIPALSSGVATCTKQNAEVENTPVVTKDAEPDAKVSILSRDQAWPTAKSEPVIETMTSSSTPSTDTSVRQNCANPADIIRAPSMTPSC